jgi:hypothetical protein
LETIHIQGIIAAFVGALPGTHRGTGLESDGNRLLKPCYLSRKDHNRKIKTRKQRTDVGKYSFVNRNTKSWNQLPAGLVASFPCKLNNFRKWVKNVVTSKEIHVGAECK